MNFTETERKRTVGSVPQRLEKPDADRAGDSRAPKRARFPRKYQPGAGLRDDVPALAVAAGVAVSAAPAFFFAFLIVLLRSASAENLGEAGGFFAGVCLFSAFALRLRDRHKFRAMQRGLKRKLLAQFNRYEGAGLARDFLPLAIVLVIEQRDLLTVALVALLVVAAVLDIAQKADAGHARKKSHKAFRWFLRAGVGDAAIFRNLQLPQCGALVVVAENHFVALRIERGAALRLNFLMIVAALRERRDLRGVEFFLQPAVALLTREGLRFFRFGQFVDRKIGKAGFQLFGCRAVDLARKAVNFAEEIDDDISAAVAAGEIVAAAFKRFDESGSAVAVAPGVGDGLRRSALLTPVRSCCCFS